MDEDIGRMIDRLRRMEDDIEKKFEQRREALQYRLENKKIVFEKDLLERQRRLKVGLLTFLRRSSVADLASALVVYALAIPLALMDIGVWFYQRICFPLWGLAPIARSDYLVLDRHRLAYLNGIQKLNCHYCAYANGVIALVREVASQTEQYWCPIKHASRMRGTHSRYLDFLEYGDAEGFHQKSEQYRQQLRAAQR